MAWRLLPPQPAPQHNSSPTLRHAAAEIAGSVGLRAVHLPALAGPIWHRLRGIGTGGASPSAQAVICGSINRVRHEPTGLHAIGHGARDPRRQDRGDSYRAEPRQASPHRQWHDAPIGHPPWRLVACCCGPRARRDTIGDGGAASVPPGWMPPSLTSGGGRTPLVPGG